MNSEPVPYGLLAEFEEPEDLVAAAERATSEGYVHVEAYAPFPVDGLAEALGFRQTRLPMLVLVGGLIGAVGGYLLQYYTSAIAYPLNVGGRPLNSWPAFVPVTFELTILVAALTAVLGMLALNGLPMPYHPVFHVPRFARATQDAFFLFIKHTDPKYDFDQTRRFLDGLAGASEVFEVPP